MNADQLVANVRLRAGISSVSTAWSASAILDALTEDLWSYVVPAIQALNGEYFTATYDQAVLASQQFYLLPPRAAGGATGVLKLIDQNGNESHPLHYQDTADFAVPNIVGEPTGYFFRGGDIGLTPVPGTGSTWSLRQYYTRRPGYLVSDTVVTYHTAVVTVASVTATVITTQAAHNGFPASQLVDIVDATPPYKYLATDVSATTAVSGTSSITVTGVDLTTLGIAAGDTVTLAQTSWYPAMIPVEWHSLLELVTAARILGASGDIVGQQEVKREMAERKFFLESLSEPRAQGSQRRLNAWR